MRHPLPYAFARTQQMLLEDNLGDYTLWLHPASTHTAANALSEVMRKYPVRQIETLALDALLQRISAAYAQGESSAASVVSEVESDAVLSRMMQ